MVECRYLHQAVYIFENSKAQRVKVGMTGIGVNNVVDRLRDVNDMWLERKVSCQICGKRIFRFKNAATATSLAAFRTAGNVPPVSPARGCGLTSRPAQPPCTVPDG